MKKLLALFLLSVALFGSKLDLTIGVDNVYYPYGINMSDTRPSKNIGLVGDYKFLMASVEYHDVKLFGKEIDQELVRFGVQYKYKNIYTNINHFNITYSHIVPDRVGVESKIAYVNSEFTLLYYNLYDLDNKKNELSQYALKFPFMHKDGKVTVLFGHTADTKRLWYRYQYDYKYMYVGYMKTTIEDMAILGVKYKFNMLGR